MVKKHAILLHAKSFLASPSRHISSRRYFSTLGNQVAQFIANITKTVSASFAISILTLPVSLIALSTAPVVYHHFIAIQKTHPQRLAAHFARVTAIYILMGAVLLLPLLWFGDVMFGFAFGDVWAHAGKISGMLSIAYVGTFTLTGVQSIFMVTRRLWLQFFFEVATSVPAIGAAIFCLKTMDFDTAIVALSLIWLLRNILLLCAAFMAALQHPADAISDA